MRRREALLLPLAAALGAAPSPGTALCLNEDPNHFFGTRTDRRVTEKDLTDWVDQYAGTQVRELMLCVNAQRTAYDSKVWTSFWKGYDPKGPDDQPLFASLPPESRKASRAWVHTAWQMNQDGLDPFRIWIRRAREKGLSPWISVRMNDLHNVDDERHMLHSEFWKAHPEFRRIPYRGEQRDKALDFGREEVREYTFRLLEEVTKRYDFDGLELDWMRHGFHFAPGREAEGREHLNVFHRRVRKLVGGRKKIGVRVPPHPETALRLGLDAVTWAREGNADLVVPTNYWRTTDTNMPVRLWRQLLPARTLLGGGLELGLNPYVGSTTAEGKGYGYNSLETARGSAAAMLEQGADRVYLFNYMDSQTAIEDMREYPPLLHECGRLSSLAGKARRHVVTYTDTWAPGEARRALLPAPVRPKDWSAFRIATGPVDGALAARVRLGLEAGASAEDWTVRVNNVEARLHGREPAGKTRPWPSGAVWRFDVPQGVVRGGDTVIEVTAGPTRGGTVTWVEVALSDPASA